MNDSQKKLNSGGHNRSGPPRGVSEDTMQGGTVASVIIPCSARKTILPEPLACAISLPVCEQRALESAWLGRLKAFEIACTAAELYSGRGAHLGRAASKASGSHLYFASAGLGLVASGGPVPSYALTVADRGTDAVAARTRGHFDPSSWWRAVSKGPYSIPLEDAFDRPGRSLIALTRPYAVMMATALSSLPPALQSRMRLFGWKLDEVLPPNLHSLVMPYDKRLDAVLPGTQNDFAHRALLHFLRGTACLKGDNAASDRADVIGALTQLTAPERPVRPRVSDGEILRWIDANSGIGIQRSLRRIRDEGIACEQARFAKLYRQSRAAGIAA